MTPRDAMADREVVARFMEEIVPLYFISSDDGESYAISYDDKAEAERFLSRAQCKGLLADCRVVEKPSAPPAYDDEYAPRSLMGGVEQEIAKRGWWERYIIKLGERVDADVSGFLNIEETMRLCTAPAAIRCAAAADTIREMEAEHA